MSLLRPSLIFLLFFSVLTGGLYPLLITLTAQALFHDQANGSLLHEDGVVRGSRLIGQTFVSPAYFWSRPSATAAHPYDAAASSGSNLGPLNPALHAAIAGRVAALQQADPQNQAAVPVDLVTSSGSGLDPAISPSAAHYQVQRVARARGVSPRRIEQLVARHSQGRSLGVLGEATVHVLTLNLALDRELGQSSAR